MKNSKDGRSLTKQQRIAIRMACIKRRKAFREYKETHPELPTAFETNRRKH